MFTVVAGLELRQKSSATVRSDECAPRAVLAGRAQLRRPNLPRSLFAAPGPAALLIHFARRPPKCGSKIRFRTQARRPVPVRSRESGHAEAAPQFPPDAD